MEETGNITVFQFKIQLKGIKPKIWRRIQISPSSTFRHFQQVIKSSMGWTTTNKNYRLHNFQIRNPDTGSLDIITTLDDHRWAENEALLEDSRKIQDYFRKVLDCGEFHYGYIGKWEHKIVLERVIPQVEKFPVCVDGRRACPPEDFLGAEGYKKFLAAFSDPRHPDHGARINWIKQYYPAGFDPEKFEVTSTLMEKDDGDLSFQLKVVLQGINPPIWRRILIPAEMTFRDLHVAIQKAMGWQSIVEDCHNNHFIIKCPHNDLVFIGRPECQEDFKVTTVRNPFNKKDSLKLLVKNQRKLDENCYKINVFLRKVDDSIEYEYDFYCHWKHDVILEDIIPNLGLMGPKCVAGARACPPENSGGIYGYNQLLKIMRKPTHKEYKSKMAWLKQVAPNFKPEEFNPDLCFSRDFRYVCQVKIVLKGIHPRIWRRIQFPGNYSFRDFHVAIQKCMSWLSIYHDVCHHVFLVRNPHTQEIDNVGMPDYDCSEFFKDGSECFGDLFAVIDEKQAPVMKYLTQVGSGCVYKYDRKWLHEIKVEKICAPVVGESYPKCIEGERASPPENCGGIDTYKRFLDIISDTSNVRHNEANYFLQREYPGFNPDKFYPELCFNRDSYFGFEVVITLSKIKPEIWRKIHIPDRCTFAELHYVVQKAMGWKNIQGHKFSVLNQVLDRIDVVGMADADGWLDEQVVNSETALVGDYFMSAGDDCVYSYGCWKHEIVVMNMFPLCAGVELPRCVAGDRACPPENCGGVQGYKNLLKVLSNSSHEFYRRKIKWVKKAYPGYKPLYFDPNDVRFG